MNESKKAKKRKPLWLRIFRSFLLSVLALLLLLLAGAAVLLTPKRLTPVALRLAEGFFIADVRFDTLKVSLFEEFPYINITVKNGTVRSRVFDMLPPLLQATLPPDCDSLLRFEELSVSLHLPKLLHSQAEIRRVRLSRARINAYMSPYGMANWDIYLPDTTMVNKEEAEAFKLNLQRLSIRNGFHFTYLSDPDTLAASLHLSRLFLRGDFSDHLEDIKLELLAATGIRAEARMEGRQLAFVSSIDSLRLAGADGDRYTLFAQSRNTLSMAKVQYAEALPVAINGQVGFSHARPDSLYFDHFNVSAAGMPLTLDGSLVLADPLPRARLTCRMDSLSAAGVLNLLPDPLLSKEVREVKTDIWAKIDASVDYPAYTLDIRTSGGHLDYPAANAYIQTLALDASYAWRPDRPQRSGITLRRCDVEASGLSLHAAGTILNLLKDPRIDISLQGHLNLDTLRRILPLPDDITARGALSFDVQAQLLFSHLLKGNTQEMTLRGRADADRLLLRMPKDTLFVLARNNHLSFGINQNQRDSLIDKGTQILRLSFRADSANLRYKQQFRLSMGGTRFSARSAASALSGDTTQIHPFTGSFEAKYLSFRTADSTQLQINGSGGDWSLLPAPHDPSAPVLSTQLQAAFLQMRTRENQYQLVSPQIALHATRIRPAAQRRGARPDSLSARDRPSRVVDDFTSSDFDLEMDNDTKRLLREWQLEGDIQAQGGALSTPYFPLPVVLGETNIEVSTQEIRLMQTEITAGRSRIECTGKISNLRQVLLGRGRLGLSGFFRADTLELNELLRATHAGALYASSGVVVDDLDEVGGLLIIPANLALDIKLFSDRTYYGVETLTALSGSLTSQNRALQINDLEASSSAGDFKLSALYATRSKRDITAGFDLEMQHVQVEKLIALIPSIDTLAPMLRSFEGVVNCEVSAVAAMDTAMNILLPTLKAACRIQGQNMVLLDGETFAEISKRLYFKNKNRNLINHIAVDFMIHDNLIQVFPFIIEMDRYRAAVSGIHRLDMSFDYHISVLHSPIPFRLGIDVTGTLDHPRYRIVRCKYHDTNIPSYVELIDATRIDLMKAIRTFDPAAAFRTVERSVSQAIKSKDEEEEKEKQ